MMSSNGRTFVLIFFFWAVLTVVTPTLILLSESSKPDLEYFNGDKNGVNKARKMMVYTADNNNVVRSQTVLTPTEAPSPAPIPEPGFISREDLVKYSSRDHKEPKII